MPTFPFTLLVDSGIGIILVVVNNNMQRRDNYTACSNNAVRCEEF